MEMGYRKPGLFFLLCVIFCLGYMFLLQESTINFDRFSHFHSKQENELLIVNDKYIVNESNGAKAIITGESKPTKHYTEGRKENQFVTADVTPKVFNRAISHAVKKTSNGNNNSFGRQKISLGPKHRTTPPQRKKVIWKKGENKKNQPIRHYPKYLDKMKIKDVYSSGFLNLQPTVCPYQGKGISLVLCVQTAPEHFEERNAIRATWGNPKYFKSFYSFVFFVGISKDEIIAEQLRNEISDHRDMIQGTFVEDYFNLTIKTVAMLEWVVGQCSEAKYIMKVDDDMFVNLAHLQTVMSKILLKPNALFGKLAKRWKPIRNLFSKYFVSKEMFPGNILPDFVTGPAYLIPIPLAGKMYSEALTTKYLFLEDVFLTGVIANKLKIQRHHLMEFSNGRVHSKDICSWQKYSTMHDISPAKLEFVWEYLETHCGYKPYN